MMMETYVLGFGTMKSLKLTELTLVTVKSILLFMCWMEQIKYYML